MPDFLATYDLKRTTPAPHAKFLELSVKFGWWVWITPSAVKPWYRLPNTTLEGAFSTQADAVQALKDLRHATEQAIGFPVTMEKWVVVPSDIATFNSDVTYPKTAGR